VAGELSSPDRLEQTGIEVYEKGAGIRGQKGRFALFPRFGVCGKRKRATAVMHL
jgi:hypothetical protein